MRAFEKSLTGIEKLTKCIACRSDYIESYYIGFVEYDVSLEGNQNNKDY